MGVKKMKHAKLPWKVVKTALNAISVKTKGGALVCEIINDDSMTLTPLMEDNAAFIVRAVNCHEELLGELRNIADAKRFSREHFRDDTEFSDWAQSRARFTIAKAGG